MNPMIYRKIAEVQCALLGRELPKSGYNSFNKFHYHELEDLLPAIMQECFKRDLMLFFNFTEDAGVLKIKDFSTEGVEMNVRVPMPQIQEMRTMNIVQSEGAFITYLKRYLLVNTFLITEKDVIDSDGATKRAKTPKKQVRSRKQTPKVKKQPQQPRGGFVEHTGPDGKDIQLHEWPVIEDPKDGHESFGTPKPVSEALATIVAKGIPITREAVKNHIQWDTLSTEDRVKSTEYINRMGA